MHWPIYLEAFATGLVTFFPIQFLMFLRTVEYVFATATFQCGRNTTKCTFCRHVTSSGGYLHFVKYAVSSKNALIDNKNIEISRHDREKKLMFC